MSNEFSEGNDNNNDWLEKDNDDNDYINKDNEEEHMVLNPVSVRQRIDAALEILGDFGNRSDKTISRQDILSNLSRDLSEYYGYIPDLVELLLDIFSPAECVEYMDASDRPRPLVIRANTIKVTRKDLIDALSKRGVNLEAVEWSKVAIKVTESTIPIGATPEYLAGYYMLQAAASLNPVMALAPVPGERVLDMSSAPGGKTSYIAQLMKNSGTVVANDLKPQRQKATVANLHRLGVKNTIVCCYDGRKIPKIMRGFDRVLLDAPCSGLGIISRDQSVKLQRTLKDVQRLAHLQKELLCAAVDACDPSSKTGGIIVYSTCSISTEENEQVVQYILQKRHVRLIETGLEVGRPGFTRYKERRFHPSLALTRRFYPHVHNMDGFYVAKFKKYANGPKGVDDELENEEEEDQDQEEIDDDDQSNDESDNNNDDDQNESDQSDDSNDEDEDDNNINILNNKNNKNNVKNTKNTKPSDKLFQNYVDTIKQNEHKTKETSTISSSVNSSQEKDKKITKKSEKQIESKIETVVTPPPPPVEIKSSVESKIVSKGKGKSTQVVIEKKVEEQIPVKEIIVENKIEEDIVPKKAKKSKLTPVSISPSENIVEVPIEEPVVTKKKSKKETVVEVVENKTIDIPTETIKLSKEKKTKVQVNEPIIEQVEEVVPKKKRTVVESEQNEQEDNLVEQEKKKVRISKIPKRKPLRGV